MFFSLHQLMLRIATTYVYTTLLCSGKAQEVNKKIKMKTEALEMWEHRSLGRIWLTENKTSKEVLNQFKLEREITIRLEPNS